MLPLIGNPFGYLVAIVARTLVSTALVIGLKNARRSASDAAPVAVAA